MYRRIVLVLFLMITLFSVPVKAEEKPVEAEIVYKQVGGRVVEVVRIKTNTGKVYEIYPGVAPNQVPKVGSRNRLSFGNSGTVLLFTLGFLVGILITWVVIKRKYEKE